MQHAVAGLHLVDDAADQDADAELVDLAHVGDADAALAQQVLFQLVDRADAEQFQPVGIDRCARLVAEKAVEPGLAAQERRRHAVHVAGQRGRGRVVVGMRVEPQHEQLAAGFAPVPRHAVHRAHRQRVIAAEKDRDRAGSRQLVGASAQRPDPALDFAVMPGVVGRRVGEFGGLRRSRDRRDLPPQIRAPRAGSRGPPFAAPPVPSGCPAATPRYRWARRAARLCFTGSGLEKSVTANPLEASGYLRRMIGKRQGQPSALPGAVPCFRGYFADPSTAGGNKPRGIALATPRPSPAVQHGACRG